ncbi:MAG: DUF4093 domain-containing protein [Oscillospiraceae bacterium]|nr:DUF4093 domain-containing protein [Oscillospiraceae bacterium]
MIKIKQAIIVEGRYDKIKLSNLVDAVIIPTDGFAVFKDRETAELIKMLAKKTGIIILTDSDSAGFQIRARVREIAREGEVINVYIPDVEGKEKRKRKPSKQGLLGVEGIDDKTLLEAFERAGVFAEKVSAPSDPITKADLMELGLVGGNNSASLREKLQRRLGLPARLSANMLLEILNVMYSREEFVTFCNQTVTDL